MPEVFSPDESANPNEQLSGFECLRLSLKEDLKSLDPQTRISAIEKLEDTSTRCLAQLSGDDRISVRIMGDDRDKIIAGNYDGLLIWINILRSDQQNPIGSNLLCSSGLANFLGYDQD